MRGELERGLEREPTISILTNNGDRIITLKRRVLQGSISQVLVQLPHVSSKKVRACNSLEENDGWELLL